MSPNKQTPDNQNNFLSEEKVQKIKKAAVIAAAVVGITSGAVHQMKTTLQQRDPISNRIPMTDGNSDTNIVKVAGDFVKNTMKSEKAVTAKHAFTD